MPTDTNNDKIKCPKCEKMMIPNVVKEGCGGNRTERICPLCGKVLSKKGMACCFIATAAYGSPLNEKVGILCSFRDEYLLKCRIGSNFANFYYDHSPFFAEIIEHSSLLRSLVRFLLYPIILVVRCIL